MCGNKSDLYESEAVPEEEARDFAQSKGAVFHLTSAQDNTGISELFYEVGGKFLDPSFQAAIRASRVEKSETTKGGETNNTNNTVKIQNDEPTPGNKKKKKKCC